ncbi:SMP-30/gluconolactonase/LRE family protein [Flavobacterium aquidurense]|uniref:SMP-30/gluconolactonase/LRE family protein n=1 Tax=Flavobacterium aquidurense TaxID=362413 RepID=UPI002861C5F3|nr:SMP-30/gluconolactonase/LRE family protein [Flavobacterium aquidurense]MDR7369905.1 sugar lactone lactonase YvrE [Flavobacterium aquidurense]
MKKSVYIVAALLSLGTLHSQNIEFTSKELYPEGTAYSPKQDVFFVSSVHYGKIGKVDYKGNYQEFINDPELIATVGILADDNRNLLYVTITDNGVAEKSKPETTNKLSKIAAYDLKTGKRKFIVDLQILNPNKPNFVNDLTIDAKGNLYATNSFSPIIFKINPQGKASIFAQNTQWTGEGYNLNGIVYHKDGYLIAAQSNTGTLFKIDINDGNSIKKISTPELKGADGLILNGKNELLVISHASYKIFKLQTSTDWKEAAIKDTQSSLNDFPTTGVFAKGKYYVLNAKLNELFNPKSPKSSTFVLQEIK